jgi:Tfp pilus assembly protein PilW
MSRPDLRDESGFTLMELLVAMAAGVLVSMATLAIVIASVHFSSNQQDRVDTNQQGRLAMERITQALNSSCVATSTPPIIAGSDTSVTFYSAQRDTATISPDKVTIALTGGSLVMTTYAGTGGTSSSNWTFSSTATTFTLISHAQKNGTVPVFKYYSYSSGGTISTTPLVTPLSSANAAATSMITISFEALPNTQTKNFTTQAGRAADFTDSIVLRLTPASSAASASNSPCT